MRLPGPLVSPEWLLTHVGDPDLRLVDTRWYLGRPGAGEAAFEAGHLPGAIFLDLDADLSAPPGPGRHPLPDPVAFAALLAARGIDDGDAVVAYDDSGAGVAARLWWMLDNLGVDAVGVLDGGIGAWTAAGGSLETGASTHPPAHPLTHPPTRLAVGTAWRRTVDRDELRARLGSVVVIDGRAPERYRGEVEPVDPVAGHIPTAVNAPLGGNLGPDGRFLGPDALAARFRALGADAMTTVVSCGSGTNACQLALAMRVAGLPDPLLYPGSWSDWSTVGYPVATGPDPGEPA